MFNARHYVDGFFMRELTFLEDEKIIIGILIRFFITMFATIEPQVFGVEYVQTTLSVLPDEF